MIVRAKGESVNLMLFSLKAPCTTGAVSLPTGDELEYPYATFNLLKIQIFLLIHPQSAWVSASCAA